MVIDRILPADFLPAVNLKLPLSIAALCVCGEAMENLITIRNNQTVTVLDEYEEEE